MYYNGLRRSCQERRALMECRKCKKEIPDNSIYCNLCGTKQERSKSNRHRGNGEGTVYQRGKTWTARVIVGWWVDDNCVAHPHIRTKGGFRTKREALECIPELKRGSAPDVNITFQNLYQKWSDIHFAKIGDSTAKGYATAYNHFKPIWGIAFKNLDSEDLQKCLDEGNKGRRTKETMKALAGCLYKFADKKKITDRNESVHLDVGRDRKATRPAFSTKQVDLISKAAANGDIRAVYTLCLIYTGFRPNEMLTLTRDAYHKEADVEYFVGGGKTAAGTDRTVPISPKIKPYIYPLLLKADPFIFPCENGLLMNDAFFRDKYFYPLLADLGIQSVPTKRTPGVLVPYSCRHTFANMLKNVDGANKDKASRGQIGRAHV